jgi:hypothetical protein
MSHEGFECEVVFVRVRVERGARLRFVPGA